MFVLLLSACSNGRNGYGTDLFSRFPVVAERVVNTQGDTVVVCDFSLLKDTIDLPLGMLFSGFEIIDLEEENDDAFIADDGRCFVSENYVGVYSSKSGGYKLFERSGKFLCHLSRRGSGPDEYLAICDSHIDETNGRVYLLPWQSRRILVCDLQGNLLPPIPLAYGVTKGVFRMDEAKRQVTVGVLPFEGVPSVIWTQDFEGNIICEVPAGHLTFQTDFSNEMDGSQNTENMDISIFHWAEKNDTLYHYDESACRLRPAFTVKFNEDNLQKHDYNELPGHFLTRIMDGTGNDYALAMIDRKTLRGGYVRAGLDMCGNISGAKWNAWNRGYYISNMDPGELKEQLTAAISSSGPDEKTGETLAGFVDAIGENDNNYLLLGKLKQPGEAGLQEKAAGGEYAIAFPQHGGASAKSGAGLSMPRKNGNEGEIPPPVSLDDEDDKVYRWNEADMKHVRTIPVLPDANEYFRRNNRYADWDIEDKRYAAIIMIVEKDGRASDIKVEESSGISELDDEAVRLVKEAVRHPGISTKGKPIRCGDVINIIFFPPLAEGETPRSRGK
jgi:hypothetical protein